MVKRYSDEEQVKMGIRCNDFNVPEDHISRFYSWICGLLLPNIRCGKRLRMGFRQNTCLDYMIYAKMEPYMKVLKLYHDMAKYHDIYKYLGNNITP